MFTCTQKEIEEKIDKFNWTFKVGDNIKHNLEEVFFFYKIKKENCSSVKEVRFLNKHISITLVAIIEAILNDFIVMLGQATNHFPKIIDSKKKDEIKKYISKEKVLYTSKVLDRKYLRIKNYSFSQILKLLKKFELLENKESLIYSSLEGAAEFRNRIHIYNWYFNFETDEAYVFTGKRLEVLEELFISVLSIMEEKYSRPWK
ncbi:MAG: hypothetical protein WCV55_01280 [Candidatus Paceibacterota bacterium]